MIGSSLSHFRITGKLGEGGMGVVYRAEDRKLDRQVALKVLHTEFVTDDERRKRFIREARTAAAVSHPNIAAVHQIDEEDGVIFIAMELVEGKTLKEIIDARPLQSDTCLGFALEMAEGLARAHDAGIVHRDLKPENIIIGPDGHLKILDFGLAKLYENPEGPFGDDSSSIQTISAAVTREGRILGTVAYMSPEQARGLVVDARSDVFTFGILLYEMTTGKKPFQGETITDTLTAILRDVQEPVAMFNPQVPAELERIMARCLEKSPDDRYQNAGEILADLRHLKRLSDSQPVPLVSDSVDGLRAPKPIWRRPAVWAAAVILAAAAAFTIPRAVEWLRPGTGAQILSDSLAVLPFENLQDGEDPQRLGQILQELIIADLSELASPRVLSSQRLFDIQRQLGRSERATIDRDMATDVALRAGAATMLTGTLSQLGANWILTCQLIDVRDGTVIKSERLDGDDLYAMVDNLTGLVRKDLGSGGNGAGTADRAVKDRTSASLNAYQAFLEGVDLLNALEFDTAARRFEKAVEIDPSFGQAYYKLAIARWWSRSLGMKDAGKFVAGPGEDLRALLDGEVKLSRKDRMLAEAFLDLVEMRSRSASARFEKILAAYPDEKEAWYGLGEARFHGPDGPTKRIDALEPFERAIALDPSFALAYYHLIDLYVQDGRFDEGIAKARSFIEQDPENPAWYLGWVRAAIAKGDAAATDAAIDEVLAMLGDSERQGYLLQGASEAYVVAGDLAKAEALLQKALKIESGERKPDLLATLAGLAHARGDTRRSEKLYRKALDFEPQNEKALKGLFHLLETERRYAEAGSLARGLAAEHPEKGGHYSRWLASAVKSGDRAEAASAWSAAQESIASGALDARAAAGLWQTRIKAHLEIRDLAAGLKLCREALATAPPEARPALHGLQGWVELELGRLDEAAASYRAAEQDGTSAIDVELGLSMVDTLRGNADSALGHADRLTELAGGTPWSRAKLVEALLRNGHEKRAEEIARLDAGAWTPKEAKAFNSELAMAYLGAGFLERAEESIRAAIGAEPAPGDTGRLARLGWILMSRGDGEGARDVLEQGLKLSPENGELLYALAVSDLWQGDAAAAERGLGKLLSNGPVRAEGHMVRAYALAQENRFEEAVAEAERAFAMLPNRDGHAVLAWTLVEAGLDVERGLRLAEEALALPAGYYAEIAALPFTAPAEHTAGLAYLKLGRFDEAVVMLERAAALRPSREAIDDDLRQVRPMVTQREP